MKKERKCNSCHLSYRGIKTHCPTCHKKTPLGKFNVLMCVVGYISAFYALYEFVSYLQAVALINTIFGGMALLPFISAIVIIAIIVGIVLIISN